MQCFITLTRKTRVGMIATFELEVNYIFTSNIDGYVNKSRQDIDSLATY